MLAKCTKDVKFAGRTVYYEGNTYNCKRVESEDEVYYEIKGEGGIGVFGEDESRLKDHFDLMDVGVDLAKEEEEYEEEDGCEEEYEYDEEECDEEEEDDEEVEDKKVGLFAKLFGRNK